MTTTYRHLLSLLPALLLTMLCGCGSDDATRDTLDDGTISFMAASDDDLATRGATVTRGDFDTQKQFRAWAWEQTSGDPVVYMITNYDASNIVSYNSTLKVWSTTEKYYWPDDETLVDFYAFHPVDAPFNTTDQTIEYNTTAVDGATDLLYGKSQTSKAQSTYTWGSNTYSANINFRHALSKVDFLANIVTPGVAVTIRSLELCNVYSQGTFSFPSGVTTGTEATDYGTWSAPATIATYRYPLASSDPITLTAEATALGTSDYPLQLVPQTRDAWNPNTNTIADNDALATPATPGTYLKIGCSIVKDGVELSDGGYVYCPLAVKWEPAKQYTYTLSFGGGYDNTGKTILTPVTITAAIEPWTTVTGTLEAN